MDDLGNLCRVCLNSGNTNVHLLLDIFKTEIHESTISGFSIPESLQTICGLMLSEDDLLPKNICSVCLSRLMEAAKLRQMSQTSQETLFDMVSKTESAEVAPEEKDTEYDGDIKLYEVEYLEEAEEPSLMDTAEDKENDIKIEEAQIEEQIDKVQCCGCEAVFDAKWRLRKHSIRKHCPNSVLEVPEDKARCTICYGLFPKGIKDSIHEIYKNCVKPLKKCEFCGCIFSSEQGLLNHKSKFHKDDLHKCCLCNFTCKDKNGLSDHAICHKYEIKSNEEESDKAYQCMICTSQFKTLQERQFHERFPYKIYRKKHTAKEEELTVTVLRCCGCPKIFNVMSELSSHQEQVHLPNRVEYNEKYPIECSGCYKRYKTNPQLNNHLRRAADKKLYACGKCTVTRRTLKDIIAHELSHTGKDAFPCCGCTKRFESKDLLEQHSLEDHANRPKAYHNDEEDITRPFECKICYRSYKSARDLRGHQRYVYYDKIHTCEICGKSFPQKKSLVMHIATHKSNAEFPCPVCGKKYKHKANVRSCVVRHERPKQHKCKICNATFSRASNLYSHMISHSEDRRFKCNICGSSFKRSFHLRKHMNSHSAEKLYACKYCSARFYSTTELYKHEIRHTGLFPYQCDICDKKLITRQVFIKHYEAHMEESRKVFTCELCPAKFSLGHFLANHIKYTHRIEPQDKQWNEKFNRKGPVRLKGGYRVKGRFYAKSTQDEETNEIEVADEYLEDIEDISEEVENTE